MEKKSIMKKITGSREALLAVILILLCLVVTAISPSFLTPKSIIELLKNNAVTLVMSLGMLCVMLVGGIDISIMSTLALSGMSIGMLLKYGHITSTLLAFIIAMAIGIACGLVVGLVISRANVPPIIATMGLFYAVGYWNSYFEALIYIQDVNKYTLQLRLRSLLFGSELTTNSADNIAGTMVLTQSLKMAIVVVSTLPILVVYPWLQKYFVKGVMLGSVKG